MNYDKPVVGIVCKPSIELALRTKMIAKKESIYYLGGLEGIDVFTDVEQVEDILVFTDRELLHVYLHRNHKASYAD